MQLGQDWGVEAQGAVQTGQLPLRRGHAHRDVPQVRDGCQQFRCRTGFETLLDRQVGEPGHGRQERLR